MTNDFTVLLASLREGDNEALGQIVSQLYGELRLLARARLKGADVPTLLDTTSLVHESYLRLLRAGQIQVKDRSHFLAYAARAMRSVVVDFVRERSAQRRGGHDLKIPMDDNIAGRIWAGDAEILKVHDALEDLADVSERMVDVVQMRYFAGLTEAQIAEALDITERTVRRDWEKARLILAAALTPSES